jgi:hypothetical protein
MLALKGHSGRNGMPRDERGEEMGASERAGAWQARADRPRAAAPRLSDSSAAATVDPFLRVPPFPGSTPPKFAERALDLAPTADEEIDSVLRTVRLAKVGGTYWGCRSASSSEPYVLIRVRDADERTRRLARLGSNHPVVIWVDSASGLSSSSNDAAQLVAGVCDPWHLLSGASVAIVDGDDELALIAALAEVPLECVGSGPYAELGGSRSPSTLRAVFKTRAVDAFA